VNLPVWVWAVTIVGLLTLIALDFLIVNRRPHEVSVKEAALWVTFYVTLAMLFGLGLLVFAGSRYAGEFFAGYLTEYSLSVDNLFVFVIIMARFAVPAAYQQTVLLIGVGLALVLRGAFIAAGAAAVEQFQWLFYLFGLFLVFTAVKLMKGEDEQADFNENAAIRAVRRVLPTSRDYDGTRLTTRVGGRRMVTPMFVVIVAIGTTDLLFALDSIPAIFGLTKEPFLIFTANAFALMGLRQLYFLIGGLLNRLVYLSYGLSVILGFIGVKLIVEALHHDGFHWAPEIPILVSLGFIMGTLALTVVASLMKARRDGSRAYAGVSSATAEDG
jgi:TerC family integral membrane protein